MHRDAAAPETYRVDVCILISRTRYLAQVKQSPEHRRKPVEQMTFLVKGSSSDPYELTFIKDGDSLTAICTCPAGTYGNFCKHRIAILDGDAAAVVSENAEQVAVIGEWLVGTDVGAALQEMRDANWSADEAKQALAAVKRKLAKAMNS